ncbi:hypothetical protein [Vulgatibacter sp.]|uniref:hypothetical protein n=1 Tax=Vulgatibacter sp. TaxID=1971226 RepID=UPI003569942C
MSRVLLLSFDEALRERQARLLAAEDHQVAVGEPSWPAAYEQAKRERPEVLVVDCGIRASRGRETALGLRESKATAALPLVLLRVLDSAREQTERRVPHVRFATEEQLATAVQEAVPAPADGRVRHVPARTDEEDMELFEEADEVADEIATGVLLPQGFAGAFAKAAREALLRVAQQATEVLQRAGESLAETTREITGGRRPGKVTRRGPAAIEEAPAAIGGKAAKAGKRAVAAAVAATQTGRVGTRVAAEAAKETGRRTGKVATVTTRGVAAPARSGAKAAAETAAEYAADAGKVAAAAARKGARASAETVKGAAGVARKGSRVSAETAKASKPPARQSSRVSAETPQPPRRRKAGTGASKPRPKR